MHLRIPTVRRSSFALLLVFVAAPASAQTGLAWFQSHPADAVNYGLAQATVALRGYPGAAAVNPATIGEAGAVRFGFNTDPGDRRYVGERWIFGTAVTQVSADAGLGRWALAYQYKNFDYGEHEGRDDQNNPTGTYRPLDAAHKLGAAYTVNPFVRAGLAVNILRFHGLPGQIVGGQVDRWRATSFSLDLGVHVERPIRVGEARLIPSAGWSLTDFGPRVRFADEAQADPLHMVMRGGLSLRVATERGWAGRPWAEIGFHGALSKTMVATDEGGTYGPFESLVKSFRTIEMNCDPPGDPFPCIEIGVGDQLVRHLALDLSVLRILTLRFGRIREHPVLGVRRYDAFGIGVDLHYVAVEWASSDEYPDVDWLTPTFGFWRVTGRIPLGEDPGNFWKRLFER